MVQLWRAVGIENALEEEVERTKEVRWAFDRLSSGNWSNSSWSSVGKTYGKARR